MTFHSDVKIDKVKNAEGALKASLSYMYQGYVEAGYTGDVSAKMTQELALKIIKERFEESSRNEINLDKDILTEIAKFIGQLTEYKDPSVRYIASALSYNFSKLLEEKEN